MANRIYGRKTLFLLLGAALLLCIFFFLQGTAYAASSVEISGLTLSRDDGGEVQEGMHYQEGNDEFTIFGTDPLTLSGTQTDQKLLLLQGDDLKLTLSNVKIETMLVSAKQCTITLVGHNMVTLTAPFLAPLVIKYPLTINGNGSLSLTGVGVGIYFRHGTNGAGELNIEGNATVTTAGEYGIGGDNDIPVKITLKDSATLTATSTAVSNSAAIYLGHPGSIFNMESANATLELNAPGDGYGFDLGNPITGVLNIRNGTIRGTNTRAAGGSYTDSDVEDIVGVWVNGVQNKSNQQPVIPYYGGGAIAMTYQVTPNTSTYTGGDLVLTSNGPFGGFLSLWCGGVALKKDVDYSAVPGSTIVTINESYLSTLTPGNHTFTLRFENGSSSATVNISEIVTPTEVMVDPPKTGDAQQEWLGITMLLSAALLMVIARVMQKRKQQI